MTGGEPGLNRAKATNGERLDPAVVEALVLSALERKVINPDEFVAECAEQQLVPIDKARDLKDALVARIKRMLDLPFNKKQVTIGRSLYFDIDHTAYDTEKLKLRIREELKSFFANSFSDQSFLVNFDATFDQVYGDYGSVNFEPLSFIVNLELKLGETLSYEQNKQLENLLVSLARNPLFLNQEFITELKTRASSFHDGVNYRILSNGRMGWQKAKIQAIIGAVGVAFNTDNLIKYPNISGDKTSKRAVDELINTSAIVDDRLENLLGIAKVQSDKDNFALFWFNPGSKPIPIEVQDQIDSCKTIIIVVRSCADLMKYLVQVEPA